MKALTEDFLLTTPAAKTLYHDHAAAQPIVDYHCHLSHREIWEDRAFKNLAEIWLEGDHYKWRLMRANGIEERLITGDAPGYDKFLAFAGALERAIGNPMQHWCALELKRYFDCDIPLTSATAEVVWNHCQPFFERGEITARKLITKSNACFIGTTDDPADSLEWHRKLQNQPIPGVTVAPTFRPDRALNVEKPDWREYIATLSRAAAKPIGTLSELKHTLAERMNLFGELGCRASDHGLDYLCYRASAQDCVVDIFDRALAGEAVSAAEAEAFKTHLICFCAAEYTRRGWVMQLHYNCLRQPNTAMRLALGPDTGFDSVNTVDCTAALTGLLDALYNTDTLPKTIIYSLNHNDNAAIASVMGAFQKPGVRGYIQHGSAWWFNDTKPGMTEQMTSLASLGVLGNFVGMLTDSRSFLSYTRHEYFRRILCQLVGGWIESGELPGDIALAGRLIEDICSGNAKAYFGL